MKFHLQIYSVILKLGPGANAPIAPWVIRYCAGEKISPRKHALTKAFYQALVPVGQIEKRFSADASWRAVLLYCSLR